MRKLMKLRWHDLRNRLLLLGDDAQPHAIFRTLVGGFRAYRPQFCSPPFAHYCTSGLSAPSMLSPSMCACPTRICRYWYVARWLDWRPR